MQRQNKYIYIYIYPCRRVGFTLQSLVISFKICHLRCCWFWCEKWQDQDKIRKYQKNRQQPEIAKKLAIKSPRNPKRCEISTNFLQNDFHPVFSLCHLLPVSNIFPQISAKFADNLFLGGNKKIKEWFFQLVLMDNRHAVIQNPQGWDDEILHFLVE